MAVETARLLTEAEVATVVDLREAARPALWVADPTALTGSDPDLDAWSAMAMPDAAMLDVPPDGPARLRRPWGIGRSITPAAP